MMVMPGLPLPEYERPPVIETVLSVQFDALERLRLPHLGLYWNEIKGDYPAVEVKPPLPAIFEEFGKDYLQRESGVFEIGAPEPRVRFWYVTEDGSRLLQAQNDRFLHNWRGSGSLYPRYSELRRRFESEWDRFSAFLRSERIGGPRVNQCEVTYINHIPLLVPGGGDRSFADVFSRVITNSPGQFLGQTTAFTFKIAYDLPERKGRLHVSVNPAIHRETGARLIVLDLTARGTPDGSQNKDILDWMDLGREWIVKGFTEITSEQMHKEWGRR